MLAEKSWEGVDGFHVDDEVKVTIAGAASLLTLGLSKVFFFDHVHSIIVHPKTIRNQSMHRGYIVDESESYSAGLAWQNGPLIFSWPDVIAGTSHPGDGFNVVVHEFAHHIDGLDGEMGGMPMIESDELRQRWEQVFPRELRRLQGKVESGQPSMVDTYAATNAAEFFAVTTATFFDAPRRLVYEMPEVFEILKDYYGVDPRNFYFLANS
jgi:Mlc titration factor MtfA (ptsG expression regulator)